MAKIWVILKISLPWYVFFSFYLVWSSIVFELYLTIWQKKLEMKISPLISHCLWFALVNGCNIFLSNSSSFYNVNCLFQDFSLTMNIHFACTKVPDFTWSFWMLLLVKFYHEAAETGARVTFLNMYETLVAVCVFACMTRNASHHNECWVQRCGRCDFGPLSW